MVAEKITKTPRKSQIVGDRVQLFKISAEHVNDIYRLLKDPLVLKYLTLKEPSAVDDIRSYILFLQNQWLMANDYTYSIISAIDIYQGNPALVGQTSLYDINYVHKRAEVGIWIGSQYWRKHYAFDALRLLLGYAFDDLHLNRIQSHIFLDNDRSQHLFEKLGFQREGIARQYVCKGSELRDVYAYAILRENWKL